MENKNQSLKNRQDFLDLKNLGKRVFPNDWLIVNFKENNLGYNRVGCTVSKTVGGAVVRNKLKRWSRETVLRATDGPSKKSLDINLVFRAKSPNFYKSLKFYEFDESIQRSYSKIKRKLSACP